MAAKKRAPVKRGGSNPSTVLVIFLVFFILLSIGLGVGTYYGFDGQDKLRKKAIDEAAAAKAARTAQEWGMYMSQEYRQMLGQPFFKDDNTDEKIEFDAARDSLAKGEGKFKEQKLKPILDESMKEAKQVLGWDDKSGKYLKTFKKAIQERDAEIAALKGTVQRLATEKTATEQTARTVADKYMQAFGQSKAEIDQAVKQYLVEARKKSEEFDTLLKENRDLNRKLDEARESYGKLNRSFQEFKLEVVAKGVGEPRGEEPMEKKAATVVAQSQALLLDISRGKALWDAPVGKILRVEPRDRRVHLNKGSLQGVRPMLTFNVFGAGHAGKAEGPLKGTIEVMEVNPNSSVARITSMYDSSGREISLNAGLRGAAISEADSSMKEGDLLYNLTWGSHVAIAGGVNWSGFSASTPAEEMRHLRSFMTFLAKEGVAVDAYLDLTDSQIKGNITPKTRFLIYGATAEVPPIKEGEENPKAVAALALNEKIAALKKEAQDRGLLLISQENFAYMVGYRAPRSAGEMAASPFQPRVPFYSNNTAGMGAPTGDGGRPKADGGKMEKAPEKMPAGN